MKIVFQGISLHLVSQETLEDLRQIRNRASEMGFMIDRNPISSESQQRWYNNLDRTLNFFFLIESGGENIGVGHITAINYQAQTAECGLYLTNEQYNGTQVSVLSSLVLLFLVFEIFKLEELKAKVLVENTVAKAYNIRLGFQFMGNIDADAIWMTLSKEQYQKQSKKLLSKLLKNGVIQIGDNMQSDNPTLWKAVELFQINTDSSQIELEVHQGK